jgi:TRAP-type transport system periplasmic protein
MTFMVTWFVVLLLGLLPGLAAAQPVTLKLSFFSSDRSLIYKSLVKPFVDAINDDPRGLVRIDVYLSGKLGPSLPRQPQIVADGSADIALIVPGYTPKLFPDEAAIELPGLFRNTLEASRVHSLLVAKHMLSGYDDFFVIGVVAGQPATIHSRKRTASLAELKGQRLRVNNVALAAGMAKLGAVPSQLPLNDTADAISSGKVDGALVQLAQLVDFGIGRLVTYHYLLPTGSAPPALVMNRAVFDGLFEPAKTLIRAHSGAWLAERYVEIAIAANQRVLDRLRADKRRTVSAPTPADLETVQCAYAAAVAVNLSPAQFESGAIEQTVADALKSSGLPPHRLELEITETLLLDNTEAIMATLKKLKDMGVSIVMDDFGTGYSSLSYCGSSPSTRSR